MIYFLFSLIMRKHFHITIVKFNFFLPWIILYSLLLRVIFQTKVLLLQVSCLHVSFSCNECVKFLLLLIVILTTYLTYRNIVKIDEAMNKTLEIPWFCFKKKNCIKKDSSVTFVFLVFWTSYNNFLKNYFLPFVPVIKLWVNTTLIEYRWLLVRVLYNSSGSDPRTKI